mmetsp:Transcript_8385/g.13273  ORF Transcript_8385/g.13273 Transcript_8385/m.13273 type:complete len:92 (+) Transcript_8385:166-441(+)
MAYSRNLASCGVASSPLAPADGAEEDPCPWAALPVCETCFAPRDVLDEDGPELGTMDFERAASKASMTGDHWWPLPFFNPRRGSSAGKVDS